MNKQIQNLKEEWTQREKTFGNHKRAVLFKRFPNWLNNSIHNRHMKFILKNIPNNCKSVLDVGAGYGRISQELKSIYPNTTFNGIELCKEFSVNYNKKIGPCFNGTVQDFHSDKKYDVIIIVTLLMYLNSVDRELTIKKLYSNLETGGTIICIEPAIEFINLWKKVTYKENASPTGGKVKYFKKIELQNLFLYPVYISKSINLVPFTKSTALHHAVVIKKPQVIT
jgi:2-polyprenyl-3-methyl-5-hydroxy-6-metoxy-1,4-benzoquinol methylase